MSPSELDEILSPLTIELFDARDAMLRVLVGLNDDAKMMAVTTYVAASLLNHVARATGRPAAEFGLEMFKKIAQSAVDEITTTELTRFRN
jgi:hypothetical protein